VLGALKKGVARSSATLLLSALCQKVLPDTPQAGTAFNLSSVKKLLLVCIRGDVQIVTAGSAVDLGSCLHWGRTIVPFFVADNRYITVNFHSCTVHLDVFSLLLLQPVNNKFALKL
jgi:hypothetical protein